MKNTVKIAVIFCVVAILRVGSAQAQQAAPSSSNKTPVANSQQAPAPKTGTAPATKPGQAAAAAKSPDGFELKTDKDKASYAIGMNIGQNLKKQSEVIDARVVERGMKDALAGDKTLMTEDEAKAALVTLQANMRKKQEEQVQQMVSAVVQQEVRGSISCARGPWSQLRTRRGSPTDVSTPLSRLKGRKTKTPARKRQPPRR